MVDRPLAASRLPGTSLWTTRECVHRRRLRRQLASRRVDAEDPATTATSPPSPAPGHGSSGSAPATATRRDYGQGCGRRPDRQPVHRRDRRRPGHRVDRGPASSPRSSGRVAWLLGRRRGPGHSGAPAIPGGRHRRRRGSPLHRGHEQQPDPRRLRLRARRASSLTDPAGGAVSSATLSWTPVAVPSATTSTSTRRTLPRGPRRRSRLLHADSLHDPGGDVVHLLGLQPASRQHLLLEGRREGRPVCPSVSTASSEVRSFTTAGGCTAPATSRSRPPPTAPRASLQASLSPGRRLPGAGSYDVSLGSSNPPPLAASGVTGTSFNATGLTAGATYYWSVTARASCDPTKTTTTPVRYLRRRGRLLGTRHIRSAVPLQRRHGHRFKPDPLLVRVPQRLQLRRLPRHLHDSPALPRRRLEDLSVWSRASRPARPTSGRSSPRPRATPTSRPPSRSRASRSPARATHRGAPTIALRPSRQRRRRHRPTSSPGRTPRDSTPEAATSSRGRPTPPSPPPRLPDHHRHGRFLHVRFRGDPLPPRPRPARVRPGEGRPLLGLALRHRRHRDSRRRSSPSSPRPSSRPSARRSTTTRRPPSPWRTSARPRSPFSSPSNSSGRSAFFTIVDPFGGSVNGFTLEPRKPKTFDLKFQGADANVSGSYQGVVIVLQANFQPLAIAPFAFVNLKVGGTETAVPSFEVGGVPTEYAFFPGAAGQRRDAHPLGGRRQRRRQPDGPRDRDRAGDLARPRARLELDPHPTAREADRDLHDGPDPRPPTARPCRATRTSPSGRRPARRRAFSSRTTSPVTVAQGRTSQLVAGSPLVRRPFGRPGHLEDPQHFRHEAEALQRRERPRPGRPLLHAPRCRRLLGRRPQGHRRSSRPTTSSRSPTPSSSSTASRPTPTSPDSSR